MSTVRSVFFSFIMVGFAMSGLLSSCATAPKVSDADLAAAAAEEALAAMNGGTGRNLPGAQPGLSPAVSGGKEPLWVSSPEAVYSRSAYVSAVGHGGERATAEKNALAALAGFFGQTVEADQKARESYSEAVRNGAVAIAGNTEVDNAIRISVSMNSLVGAEIAAVWYDGKAIYYAAAIMEKARIIPLYTEMIQANQDLIRDLAAIPSEERETLEGVARYRLAATVADANGVFANMLRVMGAPVPSGISRGDEYRLQAANIIKTIPITVEVEGDRGGRIRGAFTTALANTGFRSGGSNSRYVLAVKVNLAEVELANQQNKFIRYIVDADLTDSRDKAVLLPFNITGREGHISIPEAEERAVRAAEKRIAETYSGMLLESLARMAPRK